MKTLALVDTEANHTIAHLKEVLLKTIKEFGITKEQVLACVVDNASNMTRRGVFGGALGHGNPLWVARIAKLHRKVSKIEAWHPPPFASWASGFGLEIN